MTEPEGSADTLLAGGRRSVVGRIFELLDCFATGPEEQTITRLADATGLPVSTVHRMLATLVEQGAVERSGRGRYRLGSRLWHLGRGVPDVRAMRELLRPFIVELHVRAGHTVVVGYRQGDELLLVDHVARLAASTAWLSARRLPLGRTAAGMVYLAHLPPERARELVQGGTLGLPRDLAGDVRRLERTLDHIRRTGVAVSRAGRPDQEAWVSAPVYGRDRWVLSTLSLVVPEHALDVAAHTAMVASAARAVTSALGDAGLMRAINAPASIAGPRRSERD